MENKTNYVDYKLYQLKDPGSSFYAFEWWSDAVALVFSPDDYELVYEGTIEKRNCLDHLYEMFNIAHPADYHGRSMSISDVIGIRDHSKDYWYWFYCDMLGFKEITEIWK